MFARLKTVLPYLYIPLILIVCANLLGLLLPILVSSFARSAALIALALFAVRWWTIRQRPETLKVYACVQSRPYELDIARSSHWISQTIWAVILICIALAIFVFLCVLASEIASIVFAAQIFKRYNLVFFLVLIFAILQFALRPRTLRSLTWNKLGGLWLKPPTIGAITVGGFGFIATSDAVKNPLLNLTLESEYSNLTIIVPTIICAVLSMVSALLTERIGRTRSPDDDANIPQGWFYTAFGLAFVANVTLFSLLLNSFFLTVQTHYAMQTQPSA